MFRFKKNKRNKSDLSSISKQYKEYYEKEKNTENESNVVSEQKEAFMKRIVEVDEHFIEAARFSIESKKVTIGRMQRRFSIGFNRAGRIMEQLADEKIIGPALGDKPRNVLMTKEQFELYLQNTEIKERECDKNIVLQKETFMNEERVNMYNNQYDYMTGEDFEIFVAQILSKIGFSNVQFTKVSGDQGVDIIAERDSIKYAIQCKRYSQAVGNKAVQEVFAGKSFYHCHVGAVVTNNYFTQAAKDLAAENGVVLWDRCFLEKYANVNGTPQTVDKNANYNTIEIYDIENEIVAIKDGVISKALFEYMDSVSRIAINLYIEKGSENEYLQEMLNFIKEPIILYGAKFTLALGNIEFIYYVKMEEGFKDTKVCEYLKGLSEKSIGKYGSSSNIVGNLIFYI